MSTDSANVTIKSAEPETYVYIIYCPPQRGLEFDILEITSGSSNYLFISLFNSLIESVRFEPDSPKLGDIFYGVT